jgi:hypothetical protein
MPIASAPAKSNKELALEAEETGYDTRSTAPTTAFAEPHRKFTRAGELPTFGGFANGVGNGSPLRPQTRCGMQLQMKTPAKKLAM